jgi:hypothetical protein
MLIRLTVRAINLSVLRAGVSTWDEGMSLPLLKFSGGSVDDYAICLSS